MRPPTISVSTLKELATQFGDDGRGSKSKHVCDLPGTSWSSALGTWPFCELQNLGNKQEITGDHTLATYAAGLQTILS